MYLFPVIAKSIFYYDLDTRLYLVRLSPCIVYLHLQRSAIPTYARMWAFMESRADSVFTETVQEGVDRVMKRKNYAFLAESTMAEYLISQNCENLTQIGGLLNSRGYGIGTQQGKLELH